jgi:GH15 family glucan-1,4-alpha-glucosidase
MWFDDGHYHYKYSHETDLSKIVPVSERMFDLGPEALKTLLPRESESRECDFAQLSLIWPYNIITERETRDKILENVETKLLGKHGVKRYKGDYYFNADDKNRDGNEAEWPLGITWLSIVHNKLASWKTDLNSSLTHLKKSKKYLLMIDDLMVDDAIPELYSNGKPNENMPLAWAHSFHIIALQSFINSLEKTRKKHNVEINEELEVVK